ncbi:hypothetical protein Leryth_007088 [Lithospermum erythrorhizon]|nr:hypothetical protein Leryth_007088 [Lithospermum erythrorhizon]
MEQSTNNVEKKVKLGKRKIEIKKIENKTSRQVTYSKRRVGLFRKASELCVLCGAKIAIFVTSQKERLFTFAHPDVKSILNRFQKRDIYYNKYYQVENQEDLNGVVGKLKFLEAEKSQLKELKKKELEKDDNSNNGFKKNIFWWEQDTSNMDLAELQQFRDAVEELRNNVKRKANEKLALEGYML